ncbi:P-loop containing nucleoside triphosphate hydrolase protein [Fennellomyces sp. T-0311]|nr:P-loop containing nucleoside triphosphate hydrolase protein [Fennellomyces sp. T-0311]
MTPSRSTRTITTLTPSTSSYFPRRKSSTSSSTSVRSAVVAGSASQRPGENVQVVVRCRPMTQNEFLNMAESCWDVDTNVSRIRLSETGLQRRREASKGRQIDHYYDQVFNGSDNTGLYQMSIHKLVDNWKKIPSSTVFAYGQTASGKTYSNALDYGTESEPGVIPQSVENVFRCIEQASTKEFVLRVSYLEIYNETIRDLLAPANDNLKIHEDKRRGIYVSPLTEEVVTSPMDVLSIIQQGEANRHISTTDYNLHSSRSHTIFQMVIESRERTSTSSTALSPLNQRRNLPAAQHKDAMKISQLVKAKFNRICKLFLKQVQKNLIDLAGSEKAASNQERRKEGSYINKSLLTLGTVIAKLTESKNGAGHIPFRDSKLTRILQPALSGQAKVCVICTISPTQSSIEESANTLKFAARVKRIVIHATNDEVLNDRALLQRYRGEISELKNKLQAANDVLLQEKENTQSMLTAERQQHEQQMRQMRLVRTALKEKIDHLTRLILTSSSVNQQQPQVESPESETPGQELPITGNSPWQVVNELRRELAQVKASKASTEKLLADSQQRVRELERVAEENKSLVEQVAHLEAELSITKAELQVTMVLAQESGNTGLQTPIDTPTHILKDLAFN